MGGFSLKLPALNKLVLKLLDILSRLVMAIFITVVLVSAVVTAGLRYYLPQVDEYREAILEQLNNNAQGMVVTAEKIDSDWQPLRPALVFTNVSIQHPDWDKALALDSIALELDIAKTVLLQRLSFARIDLDELNLLLTQSESGRWSLAGFVSAQGKPLDVEALFEKIWDIERINLSDIRVRMRPFEKPEVTLPALNVVMTSSGHAKRMIASLTDRESRVSRLFIETQGQPFSEEFSMQAYWKVEDYQVAEFWELFNLRSQLKSAIIGGEFWLKWRPEASELRGQLKLEQMSLQMAAAAGMAGAVLNTGTSILPVAKKGPKSALKKIKIDHISTEFLLQRKGQDIQLWMPEIRLKHQDLQLSLNQLVVQKTEKLQLSLAQVDLAAVTSLMQRLPLPEKLHKILHELSLAGELKNIHVDLFQQADSALEISALAELASVSVNAWKGAPAISNINGVVKASKLSGQLQLKTDAFSLMFPQLYNSPMVFKQASGNISWHLDDEDIYVDGTSLELKGDYGQAKGEFYLQLPIDKMRGDVVRLILDVGVKNSDARYKNTFIPKNLPPKLLSWLDENIQSGRVNTAGFIFHGPISKPAIKTDRLMEKKVVQLWLDVEQAHLSYLPDWPAVENAKGMVLLDDKQVFAKIESAEIASLQIHDVSVAVESVAKGRQKVSIKAKAKGKTDDVLKVLKLPVLSKPLGFIENWQSQEGKVSADIRLSTVIQDARNSLVVDVQANLSQASLKLSDYRLQVQKISGPLHFSLSHGLSSSGLSGEFWQEKLSAKIVSTGAAESLQTFIDFSSNVKMQDIANWSGQPVVNMLIGASTFTGQFYFGSQGAGLNLSSDLQGTVIDLPAPFAKSVNDSRALSLNIPFSGDDRELTAKLGAGVDIRFLMQAGAFTAGQINLGLKTSAYQKNKIIVGGQLAEADAEQWLETYNTYQQRLESVHSADLIKWQDEAGSDSGSGWTVAVERLHIRRLNAYDYHLEDVKYDLFDASAYWQMAIEHPQLTASLRIFSDGLPMRLNVQTIDLDLLQLEDKSVSTDSMDKEVKEQNFSALADPDLADFPDLDVIIDSIWWKKQDYGEWQFKLRSDETHLALVDLQASVKHLQLTGRETVKASLRWSLGGDSKTEFTGRFSGENLADVLTAWGYGQEITSESAVFDVDVAWAGTPIDFEFNQLVGKTHFVWKNGSFSDVGSSQSGALKVVGFFNLSLLVKRLQLDFSDLSSKGLAYDSVHGEVFFDKGILTLKDELSVKAPSSSIQLKGWADLNTDKVDMAMGVSLPLATNLPWIVALAAGLPAAAGVFVISKLLKKQVSTLFSAVYKVDGDLNKPKVEFVRLFDTGLPDLSEVNKPAADVSELEAKAVKQPLKEISETHSAETQ
ncbi:MAG: TIGR02099 family protein [Pseudomonadales bacterium]|nr:TIGR02099 family protein [Pseudomonadales bacterium]